MTDTLIRRQRGRFGENRPPKPREVWVALMIERRAGACYRRAWLQPQRSEHSERPDRAKKLGASASREMGMPRMSAIMKYQAPVRE